MEKEDKEARAKKEYEDKEITLERQSQAVGGLKKKIVIIFGVLTAFYGIFHAAGLHIYLGIPLLESNYKGPTQWYTPLPGSLLED